MAGSMTDPKLAPMHALFQQALLSSPGLRIAGGTDEILRNIIAERVLGLPRRHPRRQGRAVQPAPDRQALTVTQRHGQ